MKNCIISPDVKFGKNVKIFSFVNLYGCEIGDNTKIGTFVEIQKNAVIGQNCKISSHTFICEGVTIEDNCFIGHSVVFINDNYPKAVDPKGDLESEDEWKKRFVKIKVHKNASIGSNATILGGITIGEGSIIGAGSVVTKNISPNSIAAGNPARIIRRK